VLNLLHILEICGAQKLIFYEDTAESMKRDRLRMLANCSDPTINSRNVNSTHLQEKKQ